MNTLTHQGASNLRVLDNEKASLWDKADWLKLSILIAKIQIADRENKVKLVRFLEGALDKKWNDKKSPSAYVFYGDKLEPLEVQQAGNLVVIGGLVMLTELMAGSAFDVPLFLASGTGTEETDENQETLSNENARNSVIDEGWRLSDGNSVKMGCRFDPNTASAAITEFGSFDDITGGTMEWRVVLDDALQHTQGSTFYMSYHSLNLNPR